MSTCCNSCDELTIPQGDTGSAGAAGRDAVFGGFSTEYNFHTTTALNPAATYLSFNNANLTAATVITANILNADSVNMTAFLALLGTSTATNKALVRVFKEFDSSQFVTYRVTAYALIGTIGNIAVTYVSGSGASPFALNDDVVFSFSMSGDNGVDGTDGTSILQQYAIDEVVGDTSSAWVFPLAFTIQANTMDNDGDMVEVMTEGINDDAAYATDGEICRLGLRISQGAQQVFKAWTFTNYQEYISIKIQLIRTSSTTARATTWIFNQSGNPSFVYINDVTGLDFTLNIDVEPAAYTSVVGITINRTVLINYQAI